MQQMNVVTTQDNERMFKILTELMHQDKEFQIVIKVPSQRSSELMQTSIPSTEKVKPVRHLEKDVTDMIHELGVPAHINVTEVRKPELDAQLVADPKNKYDQHAIEIIHAEGYKHLGYIPADETSAVREFINNQLPYPCRAHIVEKYDYDDRPFLVGEINIKRPNVSPQ